MDATVIVDTRGDGLHQRLRDIFVRVITEYPALAFFPSDVCAVIVVMLTGGPHRGLPFEFLMRWMMTTAGTISLAGSVMSRLHGWEIGCDADVSRLMRGEFE